jgi:6-phosphogluconolactonase
VTVDVLGRCVYVANDASSNISAYHIAENGALTPVAGSPFPGKKPVSVAVDFWGRFLYAANEFGGVSAYCIRENGALTSVAGSPFPTGRGSPGSIAVDFWGRFVYAPNWDDSNVPAFRIGTDGALTPVVGSPFPAGISPHSIAITVTTHDEDDEQDDEN